MKAKRLSAIWLACALALPLAAEAAQTCRSESEVPSTTPTGRFTDHGDGTVTDTLTGLMWAQCAAGLSGAGCAVGSSGGSSWQGALDLAAASTLAGYTDWRLPDVKELGSLVEEQCGGPAINLAVFPNTPVQAFWSASPSAASSSKAWRVQFSVGVSDRNFNRDVGHHVRLVRAGP